MPVTCRAISVAVLVIAACAVQCASAQPAGAAPRPMPIFSYDSLRYFARYPDRARLALREGRVRAVITVNPNGRGRIAIAVDPRSDREFVAAFRDAVGYVSFSPAMIAGRPVVSAVTVTMWYAVDRTAKPPVTYVDIVLDSASAAGEAIARPKQRRGMPPELPPVFNRQELASNIDYPDGIGPYPGNETLMVRALVERDGRVKYSMAQNARHPLLGTAAEEAVQQTRFAPAMQQGMPVAIWTDVAVVFQWLPNKRK